MSLQGLEPGPCTVCTDSMDRLSSPSRDRRDIAECVRALAEDREKDLARRPEEDPPIGKALKYLTEGLEQASAVLDDCTTMPIRAKVFSQSYIQKLTTAAARLLEGTQMLGGSSVGLSLQVPPPRTDRHRSGDARACTRSGGT